MKPVSAIFGVFTNLPRTVPPVGAGFRVEPLPGSIAARQKSRERGIRKQLPDGFVDAIAKRHGTTGQNVLRGSRRSVDENARGACYFALLDMGWTYPQIGHVFHRTRTAVLDYVHRHSKEKAA